MRKLYVFSEGFIAQLRVVPFAAREYLNEDSKVGRRIQ